MRKDSPFHSRKSAGDRDRSVGRASRGRSAANRRYDNKLNKFQKAQYYLEKHSATI